MSTILKSLKKLEKEKEGYNAPVPAPALMSGVGTHQAIHRAVQFAWLKGRILQWSIVGAGCLVISVAALYAFGRSTPKTREIAATPRPVVQSVPKIQPRTPSAESAPRNVPPPAAQTAEPDIAEAKADLPKPALAPTVAALPLPVAQRPDTDPMATSPPVALPVLPRDGFEALGQKPAPSTMGAVPAQARQLKEKSAQQPAAATPKRGSRRKPTTISEESLPETIAPVGRPEREAAAAAKQASEAPVTPQAAVAPRGHETESVSARPLPGARPPSRSQERATPSKPEKDVYAGAERMTDGALKVQAIVYAPIAEERMAVVNNTVVREGAAIESYTIVGIGEEAVYVREGQGRLLMVPFGKP